MGEGIFGIQFSEETEAESVICIPPEVWDIIKYDFDGHYTLMKFTGGYRFCFDTLDPMDLYRWKMQIKKMSEGATPEIAMIKELAFYKSLKDDSYYEHYCISSDELFNETGLEINCYVTQQSNNVWEDKDAE